MANVPVSVSVQSPDGQTNVYAVDFARDADSKEVFAYWSHTELDLPGVYYINLHSEDQILDSSLVVGNLAVTESSHQLIDMVELSQIAEAKSDETGVISQEITGISYELFRELLLVTLALLVLETLWVTWQRTSVAKRSVLHD